MAILKGIWASVVVDEQSLVEYSEDAIETTDSLRGSNTIVKYVEAISRAHFKVEFGWNLPHPQGCEGLRFQVSLDGKSMDIAVCQFKDNYPKSHMDSARRCVDDQWTCEKFRFTDIISDDGQSGSTNSLEASDLAGIGKIVLSVVRLVNIRESTKAATGYNRQTGSALSGAIPEKALKGRALSHKTSLDPPEKIAALRTMTSDYIDQVDSPFVKFEFRYRSRRALQIEGIIPRSPSPVPLEDRPVESLTREEAIELLARRNVGTQSTLQWTPSDGRPQARSKPEIKNEASAQSRPKRERDPEFDEILASSYVPKKGRGSRDIEVIDLLDD
ncbi:hypothetical protein MMC18_003311 [Xylographa bjoerkii]|nr:hypothetical protein [Xylographa bjoerkii]